MAGVVAGISPSGGVPDVSDDRVAEGLGGPEPGDHLVL